MSAKVIVPDAEGYSEAMLESMLRRTLFPSSFFNLPVPARGVCFAAGPDSSQLPRNFAERRLGLATFSISHEAGTERAWTELCRVFAHPQTTSSRLGNLLWFPSANDYRNVIPALRLTLVVYLGLNASNKMQILIQSGQTMEVDKNSLKRASRPNLN